MLMLNTGEHRKDDLPMPGNHIAALNSSHSGLIRFWIGLQNLGVIFFRIPKTSAIRWRYLFLK